MHISIVYVSTIQLLMSGAVTQYPNRHHYHDVVGFRNARKQCVHSAQLAQSLTHQRLVHASVTHFLTKSIDFESLASRPLQRDAHKKCLEILVR